MRPLFLFPVALFAFSPVFAQDAPLPKETAKFDGQSLPLASNESGDTESLKEYIPKDETFDTWTKLASVHVFKQVDDPLAAAQNLEKDLKKKYPDAHSRIIQNPDTGEVIIDFLILAPGRAFAEWNVMKYEKTNGGGMVVYQYALRAYGDKITDFLKGLKDERVRLVDLMSKDGLVVGR